MEAEAWGEGVSSGFKVLGSLLLGALRVRILRKMCTGFVVGHNFKTQVSVS